MGFRAFIEPSDQNQLYHTSLLSKIWVLTKNKKIVNDPFKSSPKIILVFRQVGKDYEQIKKETNFSLIETSRFKHLNMNHKYIISVLWLNFFVSFLFIFVLSREDVLNQKKKNPDANEAFEVSGIYTTKVPQQVLNNDAILI